MSVIYNRMERINPSDVSAPKKWYPVLKTINRVGEKEVALLIADETSQNRKEAEMSIAQLEKVLIRLLLDSKSVQLGDWGSFHLTCSGVGSDTKEGVTAANIKNLNVRFRPGKTIKNALKAATFISAESIVKGR